MGNKLLYLFLLPYVVLASLVTNLKTRKEREDKDIKQELEYWQSLREEI